MSSLPTSATACRTSSKIGLWLSASRSIRTTRMPSRSSAKRSQSGCAVADKLGLTEEQRKKIREAHAAFMDKYEAQRNQRRDLRHQELQALRAVLTPEQLEKVKSFTEDRVESLKNK